MRNHPRDDISPRPTLLPGARATNHTTGAATRPPAVIVAPYEPLPPPSFLVVVWHMPAGVMVFASCRVVGSRGSGSLGLGRHCPVAGALPPRCWDP